MLPSEEPETAFAEWVPEAGDALIVDTLNNVGYLIHKDRGYTSFPVVTGQRRYVRYIGRSYFAATPNQSWTTGPTDTKGDRVTFGPRGTFIRLMEEGSRTPYGIHSHRDVAIMMEREERYGSMGCVIVTDEQLDVIAATIALSDGSITVKTVYGFGENVSISYPVLQDIALAS